jgi:hypothetical protein
MPRFLGLINCDQTDPYYGCTDRQFWAWKLIDFPNSTNQASVYGLSLLRENQLLPKEVSSEACLELILAMIKVVPKLSDRRNGLAEALPYEGSFCVTALVLSNILATLTVIERELSIDEKEEVLDICSPLAEFIYKQDEYHGVISNHLATASLAMHRWHLRSGEQKAKKKRDLLITRIRQHQDVSEGWMREYGGADPGYQSWALSELVQLDREGLDCDDLIESGYQFLSYFAMPDGSFGNGVGARLTRFFFPGGAEIADVPLASFARKNISRNKFVSLDTIDANNFAPFFNDLVQAAVHMKGTNNSLLPYQSMTAGEIKVFEKAGLLIYNGLDTYRVISVSRCNDYVGSDGKQIYAATNGNIEKIDEYSLTLMGDIIPIKRMMPSPLNFLVLRILSVTVFQSLMLGNLVKIFLSWLLLRSTPKPKGKIIRHIMLKKWETKDVLNGIELKPLIKKKGFSAIHMGSQGYWQRGDTE